MRPHRCDAPGGQQPVSNGCETRALSLGSCEHFMDGRGRGLGKQTSGGLLEPAGFHRGSAPFPARSGALVVWALVPAESGSACSN